MRTTRHNVAGIADLHPLVVILAVIDLVLVVNVLRLLVQA